MSIKSMIGPWVASRLLSEDRLLFERRRFEAKRAKMNAPHLVEFFHDPADPYSQLLQHVLPEFQARYNVLIKTHTVGAPDDGAAPEREKLQAYAKMDTARLSKHWSVDWTYQNTANPAGTQQADHRLRKLGHYQGGMLYYGGEWYWGLDRLHYLESRLEELGLGNSGGEFQPLFAPRRVPSGTGESGAVIHWYLSFRSPYTAIAATRIKALADAYGAELRFRFVLPMVMRNLPVPKAKRRYIVMDAAREARRLGVPFGRVSDPVGSPVERGYSLLPWAIDQGRGFEFVDAFLTGVWSQGVNAGSDSGLRKIIEMAGLNWDAARPLIGNEDWRNTAEQNRAEMMEHGVWGVPSFRVDDETVWGQDRLWAVEDMVKRKAAAPK